MAFMNLRTALKASLAIGVLLTALIVALVFFNRFEPSDMSVLAPADAQAFLEMENIPHTISALATNKYWSEVFPALRRTESRTARLLRRLASLTGCGPAQLILVDRAQV